MFCSSWMARVLALHTSTCNMLSIADRVCKGTGSQGQPWQPGGAAQPWPCSDQEGASGQELPVAHTIAYLAIEPSLGALAVLRRQVEDAAEAGFQEAVLVLQKQPRSAAGTWKSSLEAARRRQTQGLETWADPHVTGAI